MVPDSAGDSVPPPSIAWDLSRRAALWWLLGILIAGAALRAHGLSGPFGLGWQHLGAQYALVAKNFERYGLDTRLAMVQNAAPAAKDDWEYFTHHPPGMGWTTWVSFQVFGPTAFAVKLPGVLASLLQILVMYLLLAGVVSRIAGLAAAWSTAVLPAGAFFSTHGSDLGPQSISLALLALWLDQRARRKHPHRPPWLAVLMACVASLVFDWVVFVVAGWIVLRDLFAKNFRRAILFAGFIVAGFTVHFLHVRYATGSMHGGRGGTLLESFLSHGVVGASKFLTQFPVEYIWRKLQHYPRALFTVGGLWLSAAGLLAWLLRRFTPALRRPGALPLFLGLLVLGLGYTLPFPRAVLIHQFWMIVFLPFVSLLIASGIQAVTRGPRFALVGALALLGMGGLASQTVIARQGRSQTPYNQEFGEALRARTSPEDPLLTSEKSTACLRFYAEREIHGSFDDRKLAPLLVAEQEGPLPDTGWFAVVEPPVDPRDTQSKQVLAYLRQHYVEEEIPLEQTGSVLRLFHFANKLNP